MFKNKYVVGFPFSEDRRSILLVRKLRPEWQKGKLNGIGGKTEPDENPTQAMHRECFEETGLNLEWKRYGLMTGINNDGQYFECHIFYAYGDIFSYEQKEDEQLGIYCPDRTAGYGIVENLKWLIPFGTSNDGANFISVSYGVDEEP